MVLGGVDTVAPLLTVNGQSESNPDSSFHSSIDFFASGRSYLQNLIEHIIMYKVSCILFWILFVSAYHFSLLMKSDYFSVQLLEIE